jgi:hypothetical protein
LLLLAWSAAQEEFPDMQMDIHLMPDLMQCVENSDVVFAASGMDTCQPWLEVAAVVQNCNNL